MEAWMSGNRAIIQGRNSYKDLRGFSENLRRAVNVGAVESRFAKLAAARCLS
jgi:hypothetical protein